MMLRLGVIDQPYVDNEDVTTFEVAEILEDEYKVFSIFWDLHKDEITREVANRVADAIDDNIRQGAVFSLDGQLGDTGLLFHTFLEQEEMAGLSPGMVPTKAARRRETARRASGETTEKRPSFIDTGLFKSSFIAWVETNAQS